MRVLLTPAVIVASLACATQLAAADEPGRLGIMADVGLPDGFVGSLAYRAHPLVHTHVGLAHNTNGFGIRAGVQAAAFEFDVAPYFAVEAGHYLRSTTPDWMRSAGQDLGLDDKTLERLGYQYVNGHLGLRFGSIYRSFYLQAGVSFVHATADVIKPKPNIVPAVDLYRETKVNVWLVSGLAGALVYF